MEVTDRIEQELADRLKAERLAIAKVMGETLTGQLRRAIHTRLMTDAEARLDNADLAFNHQLIVECEDRIITDALMCKPRTQKWFISLFNERVLKDDYKEYAVLTRVDNESRGYYKSSTKFFIQMLKPMPQFKEPDVEEEPKGFWKRLFS